jgi:hypothetical protein
MCQWSLGGGIRDGAWEKEMMTLVGGLDDADGFASVVIAACRFGSILCR